MLSSLRALARKTLRVESTLLSGCVTLLLTCLWRVLLPVTLLLLAAENGYAALSVMLGAYVVASLIHEVRAGRELLPLLCVGGAACAYGALLASRMEVCQGANAVLVEEDGMDGALKRQASGWVAAALSSLRRLPLTLLYPNCAAKEAVVTSLGSLATAEAVAAEAVAAEAVAAEAMAAEAVAAEAGSAEAGSAADAHSIAERVTGLVASLQHVGMHMLMLTASGGGRVLSTIHALVMGQPVRSGLSGAFCIVVGVMARLFGRVIRVYVVALTTIFGYFFLGVFTERFAAAYEDAVFSAVHKLVAPIVCEQLVGLRSVYVKFGQYIGGRADIVPPEWAASLKKLQDDLPACPPAYIRDTIAAEFGRPAADIFSAVDLEPLASASVAQVHVAYLRPSANEVGVASANGTAPPLGNGAAAAPHGNDAAPEAVGKKVIIKLQHDGVAKLMTKDMKSARRIARLMMWLNQDFEHMYTVLTSWEIHTYIHTYIRRCRGTRAHRPVGFTWSLCLLYEHIVHHSHREGRASGVIFALLPELGRVASRGVSEVDRHRRRRLRCVGIGLLSGHLPHRLFHALAGADVIIVVGLAEPPLPLVIPDLQPRVLAFIQWMPRVRASTAVAPIAPSTASAGDYHRSEQHLQLGQPLRRCGREAVD